MKILWWQNKAVQAEKLFTLPPYRNPLVFSSPIFLFKFLPLTLLVVLVLVNAKMRNVALLLASLVFYAWGEVYYVFLVLFSVLVNYFTGLWIDRTEGWKRKAGLWTGISINLGMLLFFKYSGFIVDNVSDFFHLGIDFPRIALPLAISFFTFQGLSYVIDVYRKEHPPQEDFGKLALLICFFPHLIAGPIVRYSNIAKELAERKVTRDKFVYGIKRFIIGLFKKAVIGNTLGKAVDYMHGLDPSQLDIGIAWLGIIALTLQIYFDFSGYSDMAIGLAAMFGFTFPENFDHPYTSRTMTEFWRRWHMTLSNWFRDYLYFPLGGSRKGKTRQLLNLFFVFLLMGIWHGAEWIFVLLGFYVAAIVMLERLFITRLIEKAPKLVGHIYLAIVIMGLMTIFRSDSIAQLQVLLKQAIGLGNNQTGGELFFTMLTPELGFYIVLGLIFCMPVTRWIREKAKGLRLNRPAIFHGLELTVFFLVFIYAISAVAASTYQPFIYFRF